MNKIDKPRKITLPKEILDSIESAPVCRSSAKYEDPEVWEIVHLCRTRKPRVSWPEIIKILRKHKCGGWDRCLLSRRYKEMYGEEEQ